MIFNFFSNFEQYKGKFSVFVRSMGVKRLQCLQMLTVCNEKLSSSNRGWLHNMVYFNFFQELNFLYFQKCMRRHLYWWNIAAQHTRDVKNQKISSAFSEHRSTSNHIFAFNETKILQKITRKWGKIK